MAATHVLGIMHFRDKVCHSIEDRFNGLLELVDPFTVGGTDVTVKCRRCGHTWTVKYYSLMHNNKGCRRCNWNKRNRELATKMSKSHDDYINQLKDVYGDEYTVTGKYVNRRTKVKVKHICGYEWETWPNNLLYYGKGCPLCNKYSKGERYIRIILSKFNVNFKEQYKFSDLVGRHKRPLSFDFAIFSNDKLVCLIEFDGLQHFRAVDVWGGEEKLIRQQSFDKAKDEYCKEHNIPLHRIHQNIIVPNVLEDEVVNILKGYGIYVESE